MWQRSRLRIGLVVALGLLVFNTFDPTNLLQGSTSVWLILAGVLKFLQSALILLLGFTFPSGRFVPRWTIWVCFALVIALLFANFLPELVGFALIIGLQIYRYRRVSTPRQRQQTKWVVYAVILALGITAILEGIAVITAIQQGLAVPLIVQGQGYSSPIAQLVQLAASLLAPWLALCFPLAFAAALLRSHLWDIDVLINRTLVYGGLSAILGALYAGLIIGLESLTGRIGGTVATNPLVLVVSTLAIAALVQPLRRRLQTTVDRRFYRQKYDAEQTLANFSDSLRHQIDLEQLRAQLLSVVQETMQPVQVSLWLRAPQWHFTTAAIPPDEPPANAFLP
jgi:nitrate reductase gamma subunit